MSYQPTSFRPAARRRRAEKREGRRALCLQRRHRHRGGRGPGDQPAAAGVRQSRLRQEPAGGRRRRVQGWNLLGKTMTSRTRLESLTVEVDQLRRLNDAQAAARAPSSSRTPTISTRASSGGPFRPRRPACAGCRPRGEEGTGRAALSRASSAGAAKAITPCCLIDEIDKAEPDSAQRPAGAPGRRRFDLPEGFRVDGESRIAARTTSSCSPSSPPTASASCPRPSCAVV